MPFEIHQWKAIQDRYDGTLILGNGASITINNAFRYDSLRQYAIDHNLFDQDIQKLFTFFDTTDFELILRTVWQATNVNNCLSIPDERTQQAYTHVRNCLIETVRQIHPNYENIRRHLPNTFNFIKKFATIISLNYDLIIYWTVMHGNSSDSSHALKDCFSKGKFVDDWSNYRKPIWGQSSCGLVFYPHGNLILARDKIESEFKIDNTGTDNLLENILAKWETSTCVPLFVSEGKCDQKINSIQNSNYLNTIYKEVLPSSSQKIVIYGWGLNEQDHHILIALKKAAVIEVAISVHDNDQRYCAKASEAIHTILGDHIKIYFFDSGSPGAWHIPE